jgi:hypothetical protein
LNPQPKEYTKTGTHDEIAHDEDAAFNPNKTNPAEEKATAGEEVRNQNISLWSSSTTSLVEYPVSNPSFSVSSSTRDQPLLLPQPAPPSFHPLEMETTGPPPAQMAMSLVGFWL